MAAILFIDGENFRFKCKDIFAAAKILTVNWDTFDLDGLLKQILKGITINERRYYAAKIMAHPASLPTSQRLQAQQRQLKLKFGFGRGLNKGMAFTTTRTITIRDAEVLAYYHSDH